MADGGLACTRILAGAGRGGPLPKDHEEVQAALRRVRSDMATRGMGSLGNLGRAFKRTDWNGNKRLDRDEFDDALRSVGVFLKSQELSAVFRAFDMDGSGAVNYDEFLRGMKGPMNERRMAMTKRCFDYMDKDGSGQLTIEDLKQYYTPSATAIEKWLNKQRLSGVSPRTPMAHSKTPPASPDHFLSTSQVAHGPSSARVGGQAAVDAVGDVPTTSGPPGDGGAHASSTVRWASDTGAASAQLSSTKAVQSQAEAERAAAKEALTVEFLNSFEGARGDGNGIVTWAEWVDEHADLSASIPDDDLFIGIMESAFMITEDPDGAVQSDIAQVERRLKRKLEEKRQGSEDASHTCVRLMKYYDVDHSGYITATEFRKALADLGISVERRLVGEMFRKYDADSSGGLDYLELGRKLFAYDPADGYVTTASAM